MSKLSTGTAKLSQVQLVQLAGKENCLELLAESEYGVRAVYGVNLTQVTDLNGAVRGVLKRALQVDGVIRGLHEASGDGFGYLEWQGTFS